MDRFTTERELLRPVNLCDAWGQLNPEAVGFSRQPLHTCRLSGHALRKKRWNYWCVTSPDYLFSITLSNTDYLGMIFAYLLDVKTGVFIEQTVTTLFGSGVRMNDQVTGALSFDHPQMTVRMVDDGTSILLEVRSPKFGGKMLSADIRIQRPVGHETLNVVVPWGADRFQYTSKQNCLPAAGTVKLGEQEMVFTDKDSFACLDYGRGIWKYDSKWNWACFSGKSGKNTIGLNLGAQWTDGTGSTENGLTINGQLVKIGADARFEFDRQNYMAPWRLTTPGCPAVDLTFTPLYERIAATDIVILKSVVHQMIGHFSGWLTDEAGKRYEVKDLIGWAEDHAARW
jgi:hypothetical protein